MAAQEEALNTRSIEAWLYHTRQDPKCKLCKDTPETIQQTTTGCNMLPDRVYMGRNNHVAGIVVTGALRAVTPQNERVAPGSYG